MANTWIFQNRPKVANFFFQKESQFNKQVSSWNLWAQFKIGYCIDKKIHIKLKIGMYIDMEFNN
jgi:hypothetical protein